MTRQPDLSFLPKLLPAIAAAEDLLARLDERATRSPVADGFRERGHFFDAVGAMWVGGELVHVEDLVLHDAHMDIRAPSHELTIAHSILRARRRLWNGEPGWGLTAAGMSTLRGSVGVDEQERLPLPSVSAPDDAQEDEDDPLAAEIAEMDALLNRSQRLLDTFIERDGGVLSVERSDTPARKNDPLALMHDDDWDETARLAEWRRLLAEADRLPPTLGAVIMFDAWQTIEPLRRQNWLGGLFVADYLRLRGKVGSHLFCFFTGLKSVPHDRRRSTDRLVRLQAFMDALAEAAKAGLKEMDRLSLAKAQMEGRIKGRRNNSSLPALSEYLLTRPIVSAAMVAKSIGITQRGALNLVQELGVREITGRGRYRAWGVL